MHAFMHAFTEGKEVSNIKTVFSLPYLLVVLAENMYIICMLHCIPSHSLPSLVIS